MKNRQLQKTITRLVEVSFKDGKLMENQVIRALKALKSLPRYETIWALSEYLKQLKRQERQHTMYIETVMPLSHIQLNKIKKIVEKKVKITKVMTNINPEILGGFKLRVGDEVWDVSVLGKINQIQEAIISGRSN